MVETKKCQRESRTLVSNFLTGTRLDWHARHHNTFLLREGSTKTTLFLSLQLFLKAVLHCYQADCCLLTNYCSFTSRNGQMWDPTKTLHAVFSSFLFVCICSSGETLVLLFLAALTLFSTTAYARKYFGSFSDQIWLWGSLLPPTY